MRILPAVSAVALVLGGLLGWDLLIRPDGLAGAEGLAGNAVSGRVLSPGARAAGATARDDTSEGAPPMAGPLAAAGNTLLARPLFSPDRRLTVVAAGPPDAVADMPRLTGIIVAPAGAWGIFEDGSGRRRIVAQGDRLGRFNVGMIASGRMTLDAPDGAHIVRPRFANAPEPADVAIASASGRAR